MLKEIKHIKIAKDVSSQDDLDFAFLKSTGVEYIESMGGSLWSDLNDHDPGIKSQHHTTNLNGSQGNRTHD